MQRLIWLQVFLLEALLCHAFISDFLPKRSQAISLDRRSLSSNAVHGKNSRRMLAARSVSDLNKRTSDMDNLFKKHIALRYAHDDSLAGQTQRRSIQAELPFSANVEMDASLPTLLLEDINEHLEEVRCTSSTIELDFEDARIASAVQLEAQFTSRVMVITSHVDCNAEGERKPHLVHGIEMSASSLTLRTTPTSWEESFHHVNVHFGKGDRDLNIEPFSPIKRRQAAVTTPASANASATVSFPAAPTTTPTNTAVDEASIKHSWIDTAIVPPQFPGVDASSLNAPVIPAGLTMNCKNCSLDGRVDLNFANLSAGNGSFTTPNINNFIEEGSLILEMSDIVAHMELESTVEASASHDIYKAPFPDIPLTEFYIPGIATVGPVLRPALSIGVQVSTQLNFSYGFDLSFKGATSLSIGIGDSGDFDFHGFPSPNISTLPFQSQTDNVNLTLSVGFSPQLLLTATLLGKAGEIGAGVFFDLPRITATFSQIDHVNEYCLPDTVGDPGTAIVPNSLTHIVPSVELGVGFLVDARVDVPDVVVKDNNIVESIASTGFSLPTACLSFDKAKKTYGAAAAAATSGKGDGSKSDAVGLLYDGRLLGTSSFLVVVSWIMFSFF